MTREEIDGINGRRLACWGERLAEAHCTPAVLIGIGHDQNGGDLHICVPNDLPLEMAQGFLLRALAEFDAAVGVAGKAAKGVS